MQIESLLDDPDAPGPSCLGFWRFPNRPRFSFFFSSSLQMIQAWKSSTMVLGDSRAVTPFVVSPPWPLCRNPLPEDGLGGWVGGWVVVEMMVKLRTLGGNWRDGLQFNKAHTVSFLGFNISFDHRIRLSSRPPLSFSGLSTLESSISVQHVSVP